MKALKGLPIDAHHQILKLIQNLCSRCTKANQYSIIFLLCTFFWWTLGFQLFQIVDLFQLFVVVISSPCIQVFLNFLIFLSSYLFSSLRTSLLSLFSFFLSSFFRLVTRLFWRLRGSLYLAHIYKLTLSELEASLMASGWISHWLCNGVAMGIFSITLRVWIFLDDRGTGNSSNKGIFVGS